MAAAAGFACTLALAGESGSILNVEDTNALA
jgi:hypothetical protein